MRTKSKRSRKVEKRNNQPVVTARPSSPLAYSLFSFGATTSGTFVNATTAMNCSAWWSGIRLLSDTTALLPCSLFLISDQETKPARAHPVTRLLRRPSTVMTRFTFFQTLMNHVLSHGNAFAEILRNKASLAPAELSLMDPDDIMPGWSKDGARKVYKSRQSGEVWDQADIFHVPGLGYDGLSGYNVVEFAKQAIGLDLAAEQYGAAWFGSGGRPSGHLKYPGKLEPDEADRVRATWKQRHAPGSHELALLQEGLDFVPHDNDPSKAQPIEIRRMQLAVVARFLRVPPHMLYDLDRATFSNIDQMGQEYLTFSLSPWLTLIEEEIVWKLLSEKDQEKYIARFDEAALLRGDTLKRAQRDVLDVNAGIRTVAEVRRDRGDPFIEGTEVLRAPLNYGALAPDGTIINNGTANDNGNGISNQNEVSNGQAA